MVVNGQASESLPVEASFPRGSVLGSVSVYADDCTLSFTYLRQESGRAADEVNHQLRLIQEWDERWQVTFFPDKTQTMLVSRSLTGGPEVEERICFGSVPVTL